MKRLLLSAVMVLLLATGVRAQSLQIVTTGTVTLTSKSTRALGGRIDTSATIRLNMRDFLPQLVIEVDTVGLDLNEITIQTSSAYPDSLLLIKIAKQHTVLRHIVQVEVQPDTIVGVDSLDFVGRDIIIELRLVSTSTRFTGFNASTRAPISRWIGAQMVESENSATVATWTNRSVHSRQFIVPPGRDLEMRIRTTASDTVAGSAGRRVNGQLIVNYVVTAIKDQYSLIK